MQARKIVEDASSTEDPVKRVALSLIHSVSMYFDSKNRKKKQLNPLLGETYELVMQDFRFCSEQVSHHPPISAYCAEGNGYKLEGHTSSDSKFSFGGGTGKIEVYQHCHNNYSYSDDYITVSRPTIEAHNLVMGHLYVDFNGSITATS